MAEFTDDEDDFIPDDNEEDDDFVVDEDEDFDPGTNYLLPLRAIKFSHHSRYSPLRWICV